MPRRSVTLTLVVLVGLVLLVGGALVAIAGLQGATGFEFTVDGNTIKTDSTGLAIMAVGALLVIVIILKSGNSVSVFGAAGPRSGMDRVVGWLSAHLWVPALLFVVAVALLLRSLV